MTSMITQARLRLEEHRAALERRLRGRPETASETAAQELLETQAAIDRIEVGTYGRCERCGGAIGRQRLLALPAARYCLACGAAARSI